MCLKIENILRPASFKIRESFQFFLNVLQIFSFKYNNTQQPQYIAITYITVTNAQPMYNSLIFFKHMQYKYLLKSTNTVNNRYRNCFYIINIF